MPSPSPDPSSGDLKITTGQETLAGRKPRNEDSMGIYVPRDSEQLRTKGACAVIADGVSAAEAGQQAAETCVQNFLSDYFSTPDTWTVATSAQKVLTALNRWLYGRSAEFLDAARGYVCTLSIIVIKSNSAYLFHVGDTRIWRLRDKVLTQLTRDHTVRVSSDQTFLSRAMGLDSDVTVDFKRESVEPGDLFLLTSDGVHGSLDASRICSLLGEAKRGDGADLNVVCQKILQSAIESGSKDNVTCQIVRVDQVPDSSMNEYLDRLTQLPFPPELEKGMILDGMRVEDVIHESARSQVYKVRKLSTDELFVLKTPSVNYEDDPGYIDRFSLEYWLGLRLKNEHLARSIQCQERNFLYNVMEYYDGMTLTSWLKRRSAKVVRPPEEVVPIVEQIVRGLYALHRKEIIHQDLKPDNVMITSSGVVKIIDYGSCFVSGIDEIAIPISRQRALGTRGYSAPEYVVGGAITPRVDQFSLGVLTYEMLTGRHPYGPSYEEASTLKQLQALVYQPAYEHNPRVPVWMDGAIKRAVSLSAHERYDELSEFMYDLDHPNTEYLRNLAPERAAKDLNFRNLALVLLITQLVTLFLLWRHW